MKKKKSSTLPTLRAPRGYRWEIEKTRSIVYVRLYEKDSEDMVGYIELVASYPYTEKKLETHSWLNPDLRGRGWGTLLYSKAIEWGLKRGYKVKSSGGSSEAAQNVWNGRGIRQHFTIRRRESKPYGYKQETWFAYAKATKKDRAKVKRR